MKGYLPVHCCCEPGKHLGYLPEPRGGGSVVVSVPRLGGLRWVGEPITNDTFADHVTLRVRRLALQPGVPPITALDSGHQPIEVLRTLPGWVDV
jgi:hypothetical protein